MIRHEPHGFFFCSTHILDTRALNFFSLLDFVHVYSTEEGPRFDEYCQICQTRLTNLTLKTFSYKHVALTFNSSFVLNFDHRFHICLSTYLTVIERYPRKIRFFLICIILFISFWYLLTS